METNRWIILQSLKNWKEIFTENLYIALSFILWIFQTIHCLTLVVVLGSLASLPILPISRNSFSFIRLWSSCHFCFKTNKYSEVNFFWVLQLNSIYFPSKNSEQNDLPFVLTKTSFRVEPSQTWLPLQQWWSECCLSRDWFGRPIQQKNKIERLTYYEPSDFYTFKLMQNTKYLCDSLNGDVPAFSRSWPTPLSWFQTPKSPQCPWPFHNTGLGLCYLGNKDKIINSRTIQMTTHFNK